MRAFGFFFFFKIAVAVASSLLTSAPEASLSSVSMIDERNEDVLTSN